MIIAVIQMFRTDAVVLLW